MGPVAIQVCVPCGGISLDRERLQALKTAGSEVIWRLWWKLQDRIETAESPAAADCAACGSELLVTDVDGSRVHACTGCADLWLTNEALAEVAASLADAELDDVLPKGAVTTAQQEAAAEAVRRLLPAKIACLECGEANGEHEASCWACGANMRNLCQDLTCPQCDGTLRRVAHADVEMRGCDFCGGIWAADAQLKALIFLSDLAREEFVSELGQLIGRRSTGLPAVLNCPKCRTKTEPCAIGVLLRRPVPTCPTCCGRFLDLEHLETAVLGARV
jgi:Zn-finger nucleic acid-binding protein